MHKIGIIGGMSWHSTLEYYRMVNAAVAERLGGHHSADMIIDSLNFEEVRAFQLAEDWDAAARLLGDSAARLQSAGAESVLIATNLMHKVAPAVESRIDVPLLHIADSVGRAALAAGATTVGLLGTRWVMEEDFYQERLGRHGVAVVVPEAEERIRIDDIIFDELTKGVFTAPSRDFYVAEIERMQRAGAQAIVLACTEIGLLVEPKDSPLPLLDSAECHALEAAEIVIAGLP